MSISVSRYGNLTIQILEVSFFNLFVHLDSTFYLEVSLEEMV